MVFGQAEVVGTDASGKVGNSVDRQYQVGIGVDRGLMPKSRVGGS